MSEYLQVESDPVARLLQTSGFVVMLQTSHFHLNYIITQLQPYDLQDVGAAHFYAEPQ